MLQRRIFRVLIATLATGLLLGACATKKTESSGAGGNGPSVGVKAPSEVKGNVVTLSLTAKNFTIVAADGDTAGKTGHYHIFIDRDPVAAGAVIPKEAGIVHSIEAETKIMGLAPGEHTFTVVLGDGTHKRVGDAAAEATVDVAGPGIDAAAPATVKAGEAVTVTMKVEGISIAAANGDTSGATGHLHLFIDRDPILTGPIPKEDGIVHTTTLSHTIDGLAAGDHTIWVVVGDGAHTSFADPVMDKVTVTVA